MFLYRAIRWYYWAVAMPLSDEEYSSLSSW
jgi:hypothetical protein